MTTNRSGEELAMRALIVPELRRRWPGARIIHELPLRYSTRRIDLAAVTETEIIAVEIKSSRDVADRLEDQLRGFVPISSRIIVALAPKWNEALPPIPEQRRMRNGVTYTAYLAQKTAAQAAISRVGAPWVETWTVSAEAGTIDVTDCGYDVNRHPWPVRMLDILHVAELAEIAGRHRTFIVDRRTTHAQLVEANANALTGPEIVMAVCRALRERNAFATGTDAPMAVDQAGVAG